MVLNVTRTNKESNNRDELHQANVTERFAALRYATVRY